MISGEYKHGPYQHFSVCDPKPRKISKAGVRDRVVHHLVSGKLKEIFESTFIHDSYSCRDDKGTHGAVKRLEYFIRKDSSTGSGRVVVKCDIKKFFASIDRQILIDILESKIKDERFLDLMREIIFSFPAGIPLGNLTSQHFANIYLNRLDQFVKHKLKIKNYIRYCDDFILIGNYEDLSILIQIDRFLQEKLKLQLHPSKIIIRRPNQGIDFLGYVVFLKYTILRSKTKRRMIKKIRKADSDFLETTISYFGLLKWCESYKIRKKICKIICAKKFQRICH